MQPSGCKAACKQICFERANLIADNSKIGQNYKLFGNPLAVCWTEEGMPICLYIIKKITFNKLVKHNLFS